MVMDAPELELVPIDMELDMVISSCISTISLVSSIHLSITSCVLIFLLSFKLTEMVALPEEAVIV